MIPVRVQYYLPRLTPADLAEMLNWPGQLTKGHPAAAPFAKWLLNEVVVELTRRGAEEPIEVQIAEMPLDRWTPEQIGQALVITYSILQETESPRIGDLMDAITDVLVAATFHIARSATNETERSPDPIPRYQRK